MLSDDATDILLQESPVAEELPEVVVALMEREAETMDFQYAEFGKTADGQTIEQYTLENSQGTKVKLINYGATVVSIETVDKDGKSANIVLGHNSVDNWLKNPCYFGCTVGRYANRIGKGIFGLGENIFTLAKNDGDNHLHGGTRGFSRVLWDAEAITDKSSGSVVFSRRSPDGEDAYPGTLETTVTYTLTEENELRIDYKATTDKQTVVNLTNHCYWNLSGDPKQKDILNHLLVLNCNLYLPVNEDLLPTGDTIAVANTPMNFYQPFTIGKRIADVKGGYDHCYVINRDVEGLVQAARVVDQDSGRVLEIFTTEPGIQFYSGNFLSGEDDNGGFKKHHGFCLETQHYPDSPNQPQFPSTTLKPGEVYSSTTIHKFSVQK